MIEQEAAEAEALTRPGGGRLETGDRSESGQFSVDGGGIRTLPTASCPPSSVPQPVANEPSWMKSKDPIV